MIQVSRLGFGLSSIAGSGNFAHQERLLRTAIDCGITHFDVAPYYGSGDAESILGRVLAKCPDPVTVTTKFGLVPFAGGKGGSTVRALLRPVFRQLGFLKTLASSVVKQRHQPATATFTEGSILQSLAESTAKIGRPIDILLLHDPSPAWAYDAAVIGELTAAQAAGHTRAIGLSGPAALLTGCPPAAAQAYTVAQLENSLTCPAPVDELVRLGRQVFTHRAIQGGLQQLTFLWAKHPEFKKVWLREIQIDLSPPASIAQFLIKVALASNPQGTVLFSSVQPARIQATAQALHETPLTAAALQSITAIFSDVYLK